MTLCLSLTIHVSIVDHNLNQVIGSFKFNEVSLSQNHLRLFSFLVKTVPLQSQVFARLLRDQ